MGSGKLNRNFANYSPLELGLAFGTVLLLLFIFSETLNIGRFFRKKSLMPPTPPAQPKSFTFGYEEHNGPAVWRDHYMAAKGGRQSPINLIRSLATTCRCNQALLWSQEYNAMPSQIRLHNDGHTVIIIPSFPRIHPNIRGGPLETEYTLTNIRFRWGPCDDEGSEHTIENTQYPLEMQALHIRIDASADGTTPDGMVFVSYVFEATTTENPYIEPIIASLESVRTPGSTSNLGLFPMVWLLPPFSTNFFMYVGSLSYPPCYEGVKWIVQPEPLIISTRQIRKFRKLCSSSGPLLTNARPIQKINGRPIVFYTS